MISISQPLMGAEEKTAVLEVLESGMLAQGERVRAFEQAFAAYCGTDHAVATSSGTTALHLALLCHGIGPGDEVIISPFSFVASGNAVKYVGARPIFADIDSNSFNMDPDQVAAKITPRSRAVMPVHLFGHPADMDPLMDLARAHGLAIIEDACQAHGAEYKGRKVGSFGTGCFSFYATKNMTCGEGGMVTTNDPVIADRVRLLRNHGMRRRYSHETLGFNFRMTDLQAAIGLAQLQKLDRFNAARVSNAHYLSAGLSRTRVTCPREPEGLLHVFHQYTIRVPRGRDQFQEALTEAGIGTGIYYPIPIHCQPHFADEARDQTPLPEAERAAREVLSLPVHPGLSLEDMETIISAVQCWAERDL